MHTGKPLNSTTFLILQIKFVHLKLRWYFPCHLRDFIVANDSNIRSACSTVQTQYQSHSSRNDRTMADWRRFNDHTFSQEWTLAGGVDLIAHRIHRTFSGLKEFDPMGFKPRVRAVGQPVWLTPLLLVTRPCPLDTIQRAGKDICEHLHPSGSYNGLTVLIRVQNRIHMMALKKLSKLSWINFKELQTDDSWYWVSLDSH